jgi:hypothetical protein
MLSRTVLISLAVVIASQSHAADPRAKTVSGKWSHFEEVVEGVKVCWIVTAAGNSNQPNRNMLFYVTKRKGKSPEVSIVSKHYLRNTNAIAVTIAESAFVFRRHGSAAWPLAKSDDSKVIDALMRAEKAENQRVFVKSSRKPAWALSTDGFGKAYRQQIQGC